MKVIINKVGPLNKAILDIKGITILVGDNSTGKSIITKSLNYLLYFDKEEDFSEFEEKYNFFGLKNNELQVDLGSYIEFTCETYDKFLSFNPSKLSTKLKVEESLVRTVKSIYIDNSLIMKELSRSKATMPHKNLLKSLLMKKHDVNKHRENLEIDELFNKVVPGNLVFENNKFYYATESMKIKIDLGKTGNGMQSFLLLKTLYYNNQLDENKILLLDEPEIFFHPKWQIYYAKLLIKLQEHLGLKIVLATCSIYFIEAMEKLSKLYNNIPTPKYYLGLENKGSLENTYDYIDVSNNIGLIYEHLLEPFESLDMLLIEKEEKEV